MFCADRFRITDGREIKFLVPLEQFFFIPDQRCNLLLCELNIDQCMRILKEFFHFKKLYPLKGPSRRLRRRDDTDDTGEHSDKKEERPPLLTVFLDPCHAKVRVVTSSLPQPFQFQLLIC